MYVSLDWCLNGIMSLIYFPYIHILGNRNKYGRILLPLCSEVNTLSIESEIGDEVQSYDKTRSMLLHLFVNNYYAE